MSAWSEWWHGDATKEDYQSSVRLEEAPRSSLIDRILGVEEVVRCGECLHSRIEGDTTMFMWCGYWNKPTDEMRYCSDGERREP